MIASELVDSHVSRCFLFPFFYACILQKKLSGHELVLSKKILRNSARYLENHIPGIEPNDICASLCLVANLLFWNFCHNLTLVFCQVSSLTLFESPCYMSRFVGFPLKMGFGPRSLKFFKKIKVLALEALNLEKF